MVNRGELEELIDKCDIGRQYLSFLKLDQDEQEKHTSPHRELVSQVVHLAIEAYRRGEISKGKIRDLSPLLKIPARELIKLAEAA